MFGDLWGFIGDRFTTIVAFVIGDRDREPSARERGVARVLDVIANLVFLALLIALAGKAVWWLWSELGAAGAAGIVRHNVERDPKQALYLVGLLLMALAAVLLVIEILFRLRAYAAPSRLFAAWASYRIILLLVRLATAEQMPFGDIVDALLE